MANKRIWLFEFFIKTEAIRQKAFSSRSKAIEYVYSILDNNMKIVMEDFYHLEWSNGVNTFRITSMKIY